MFVLVDHNGIALFLGNGDRRNFARQVARLLRRHGFHLACQGHAVLCFAFNFVIGGHVFGSLRHGVHAVFFFHQFIDKAPANGGVIHRVVAAKSCLGFGHHEGRAAHAFNAACNHQTSFSRFDGTRSRTDGIQT